MNNYKQNFTNLLTGKNYFPHDFIIVAGNPTTEEIESMATPPIFKGSVDKIPHWMAFKVHKVILAAQCEYFRILFTSNFKESNDSQMKIPHVKPWLFAEILRFIYSGEYPSMYNYNIDGIDLAKAADYFQLDNLYQNTIEILEAKISSYINNYDYRLFNQSIKTLEHYDKLVLYLIEQNKFNENVRSYIVDHFQRLDSESKLTPEIKNKLFSELLEFHKEYYKH